MSSPLDIRVNDQGLVAAVWRDLAIFHWRGRTNKALLERSNALNAELAGRRGEGRYAVLTIVSGRDLTLPDAEMRTMIEGTRRFESSKTAEAVVIETTGMLAAAVRSLIATMMLARRNAVPSRIVGDVRDAADWIAPRLAPAEGSAPTGDDVMAAIGALLAAGLQTEHT